MGGGFTDQSIKVGDLVVNVPDCPIEEVYARYVGKVERIYGNIECEGEILWNSLGNMDHWRFKGFIKEYRLATPGDIVRVRVGVKELKVCKT